LIADGLPVDTSSFTDSEVPRGTRLRYAVAAFNTVGESKRSNTVRVTVP
jgi:hypothetical protein